MLTPSLLALALALASCGGTDTPGTTATSVTTPGTTSTSTSTSTTGTTSPTTDPLVTVGPELPDCVAQSGTGTVVALSGVVLLPEGPVAGVVTFDRATGALLCAGSDCDTADATILCTEGVISPGLIDVHNHLQYNTLPPWQHGTRFTDRYDWQSDGRYWDYRTAYDEIEDSHACEIMKWAELREVVMGTTSAVGSAGLSCIGTLLRNLDEDAAYSGLAEVDISYSSGDVTDKDAGDAADTRADLDSGDLTCRIDHVAEGAGDSVAYELDHAWSIGWGGPGQVFVHATDASAAQLAALATEGTAIAWSPRSNLGLYGGTTPVELARLLGVEVILGPDWTPSGSPDPVRELQCADSWLRAAGTPWTDVELWERVTGAAARVLGVEGQLGALVPGARADVAVYAWSPTPYRAVIDAEPADVRLVLVDGEAQFGDADLVEATSSHPEWCERVDVCGQASRSLCLKVSDTGEHSVGYEALRSTLADALAEVAMPSSDAYAGALYPAIVCDLGDLAVCDATAPAAGDADGDGVGDGSDLCASVWDPEQADLDGDGAGDLCDPCPLMPGTSGCAHDPADIDDDGVPTSVDHCPFHHDPLDPDRDGDALGDACDPCPDHSAASGACPVEVPVLADEGHPEHPPIDTEVALSGVVVTGVDAGGGFFVQDPKVREYGGLWVYDRGAHAVLPGDVVDVEGLYQEYHGLVEVVASAVTVTGWAAVPEPLVVAACDVATGGSVDELYEAVLVRVEGVTVTDENPSDPDDWGEYEVDGCLWVDDVLSSAHDPHPAKGTAYTSLTGVLTYAFDERRLLPRDLGDVVE